MRFRRDLVKLGSISILFMMIHDIFIIVCGPVTESQNSNAASGQVETAVIVAVDTVDTHHSAEAR